jgi:hypothetical protein
MEQSIVSQIKTWNTYEGNIYRITVYLIGGELLVTEKERFELKYVLYLQSICRNKVK